MKNNKLLFLLLAATSLLSPAVLLSQHPSTHSHPVQKKVVEADVQPLLAQAMRLREALTFLGSSLSKEDEKRLIALKDQPVTSGTAEQVQHILDPYCLAIVNINP